MLMPSTERMVFIESLMMDTVEITLRKGLGLPGEEKKGWTEGKNY